MSEMISIRKLLDKLSSLLENENIMSQEEQDDNDTKEWDAKMAREKNVFSVIAYAFKRAGIPVDTDDNLRGRIYYDEDAGRVATVTLEDRVDGYDIIKLSSKLSSMGLSGKYSVKASGGYVEIEFTVDPSMDTAKIK